MVSKTKAIDIHIRYSDNWDPLGGVPLAPLVHKGSEGIHY